MQRPLDPRIHYVNPIKMAPWCYSSATLMAFMSLLYAVGKIENKRLPEKDEATISSNLDKLESISSVARASSAPHICAEVTTPGVIMPGMTLQSYTYNIGIDFVGIDTTPQIITGNAERIVLQPMQHTKAEQKIIAEWAKEYFQSNFKSENGTVWHNNDMQSIQFFVQENTADKGLQETVGSSQDWYEKNIRAYRLVIKFPPVPIYEYCFEQPEKMQKFLCGVIAHL